MRRGRDRTSNGRFTTTQPSQIHLGRAESKIEGCSIAPDADPQVVIMRVHVARTMHRISAEAAARNRKNAREAKSPLGKAAYAQKARRHAASARNHYAFLKSASTWLSEQETAQVAA